MKPATVQKIVDLNRQFYQTFAVQFDATRQRLQPGVRRLLDEGRFGKRLLDLGCGNGELARELFRRGFAGQYAGIDSSLPLLEAARHGLPEVFAASFFVQDLAPGRRLGRHRAPSTSRTCTRGPFGSRPIH